MTTLLGSRRKWRRRKAHREAALAALEMGWGGCDEGLTKLSSAQHNLVVPTFNARLMPDKPALNYWLMWTGVKMLGMN
ncbi:MAG: ArnT family glycosyltransferase, partial [Acidithiobacillus ferrooxidans]